MEIFVVEIKNRGHYSLVGVFGSSSDAQAALLQASRKYTNRDEYLMTQKEFLEQFRIRSVRQKELFDIPSFA